MLAQRMEKHLGIQFTVKHEKSSAALPSFKRDRESTFQGDPTPNNRATSLNPNLIPF